MVFAFAGDSTMTSCMVVWAVPYVCTCVYARKWGRGSEGVKRQNTQARAR